jgi:uncharacterized protein YbcI
MSVVILSIENILTYVEYVIVSLPEETAEKVQLETVRILKAYIK